MAHISRQELKSDEFVSGMDAALEFFLQHRDRIILVAVIVVVVAGAGYGWFSWNKHQNTAAATLLGEGLDTLHSPLLSSATPTGTPAFASVQMRAAAAQKQFQAVISQYPSTTAGQLAQYYLGLADLDLNDPGAMKALQKAADSSNPMVSTAAKNAMANTDMQQGNSAAAQKLLEDLANQNSPTLPRAVALMELAQLETTTNPAQAAKYYHQLQTEYPNTQTAQQATQALSSLPK